MTIRLMRLYYKNSRSVLSRDTWSRREIIYGDCGDHVVQHYLFRRAAHEEKFPREGEEQNFSS